MPFQMNITGTSRLRKSQKRAQMPLLPGDKAILRQVERERRMQRENNEPQQQLEYLGPLRNFTPLDRPLKRNEVPDAAMVTRKLLANMWTPFPEDENGKHTLYHRTVAETAEARRSIPKIVPTSLMYGVFPSSTTKVDQEINRAVTEGRLRRITVNNSENTDLVIESQVFYSLLEPEHSQFAPICRNNPQATWFDIHDLEAEGVDVDTLVTQGFLAVDPSRPGVRVITVPGQGRLLKHVAQARSWLLKTIVNSNRKFKELPESQIKEKLLAHKGFWPQLRGLSLDWILFDAIGGGWVDGFETPMGRGWKVLKR